MEEASRRLCYVMPEYDAKSHTHFAYLGEFVAALGKKYDLTLIVERGGLPSRSWNYARGAVAGSGFFGAPRLFLLLFGARLRGVRDFYVHYSFAAAFLASCLTRVLGGRVFYWNCGLPWQYRRGYLRERFERSTYRLITHLVTGTEGMKKLYAKHYSLALESIKVMPNWINAARVDELISAARGRDIRSELGIPREAKLLLFVHRLSERKGANYLPEILAALDERYYLAVIGDGPERAALEKRFAESGLVGRVRFLGWKPQNELAAYYLAADVFLMPSNEEGSPHVLLEAMAYGVPFAASNVGGVPEIAPPELRFLVVPVGDVPAFVGVIRAVFDHSVGEIAAIEREWVKKYSLENSLAIFGSFLAE